MAPNRQPPAQSPSASHEVEEEEEENENENLDLEGHDSTLDESCEEEGDGDENKSSSHSSPAPALDQKASSDKIVSPTPVKSTPESSSENQEELEEEEEPKEDEEEEQKEEDEEVRTKSDSAVRSKPESDNRSKSESENRSKSESEEENGSKSESPPKNRRSSSVADPTTKLAVVSVKPSNSKRPSESEIRFERNESKRAKADESRRQMFQRIWSEEDEIGMLKGMIDFSAIHGYVPYSNGDMIEFYDFVKNSLHGDFSRVQLTDKARRLKKKYINNLDKSESGEDPTFQKPHERKSFELSKKIWGGGGGCFGEINTAVSAERSRRRKKKKKKKAAKLTISVMDGSDVNEEMNTREPKCLEKYSMVASDHLTPINESFAGLSSPLNRAIQIGRGMLSNSVKSKLKEKWKELEDEEFELYMKKIDLKRMEAKLAMQAYRAN